MTQLAGRWRIYWIAKNQELILVVQRAGESWANAYWMLPAREVTLKPTEGRWGGINISQLYCCSPLYRNSTTILVHRTTVHMWRWFHGLVFLYIDSNENKLGRQSSPPINKTAWDNEERVIRPHQAVSKVQNRQTKQTTNKQANKPSSGPSN